MCRFMPSNQRAVVTCAISIYRKVVLGSSLTRGYHGSHYHQTRRRPTQNFMATLKHTPQVKKNKAHTADCTINHSLSPLLSNTGYDDLLPFYKSATTMAKGPRPAP